MNENSITELREKIENARRLNGYGQLVASHKLALYVTWEFAYVLMKYRDGLGQFIYQVPNPDGPPEVLGIPTYPTLQNSQKETPFKLVIEL